MVGFGRGVPCALARVWLSSWRFRSAGVGSFIPRICCPLVIRPCQRRQAAPLMNRRASTRPRLTTAIVRPTRRLRDKRGATSRNRSPILDLFNFSARNGPRRRHRKRRSGRSGWTKRSTMYAEVADAQDFCAWRTKNQSTILAAARSGDSSIPATRISAVCGDSYGLSIPVKFAIFPAFAFA